MTNASSQTTAVLFDCRAKEREFPIPKGWRIIKDDAARRGDRWWRWGDESWQPIGEHAFLGQHGTLLQCLIRKMQTGRSECPICGSIDCCMAFGQLGHCPMDDVSTDT